MFGNIELATFPVEVILQDYLLKADLKPRGPFIQYLNDRNWSYIPFYNCEFAQLDPERKVGAIRQDLISLNKEQLAIISVLHVPDFADLQLVATKRAVLFYVRNFAVQGNLHVSEDLPNEDLLDDTRDFYGVSDASVYPVVPVATPLTSNVPLLAINRTIIQAYHAVDDRR